MPVMSVAPETITTPRLVLRRPKPSDVSAVYEYGRDSEVTRYMDWPAHSHIRDAIRATETLCSAGTRVPSTLGALP